MDERRTPTSTAFLDGADYAQFPPTWAGTADVITDFNAQLESLEDRRLRRRSSTRSQSNLEAIVG